MSRSEDERLVGWKAIGIFLGRDERTVRRWEAERGLPVHRVPGGGGATVWADPADLRAWMAGDANAFTESAPPDPVPPVVQHRGRSRLIFASGVVAAFVIALPFVWQMSGQSDADAAVTATMPYGHDNGANTRYQEANFGLSRRSVAGLISAATSFGELTVRYPRNPAGFVGLAEANLLLREFNSLPNEIAYRRAANAAEAALVLDPRSVSATRALGFVRYFGDGKRKDGLALLERALRLDPAQAQSHHWYGTALLGEGRATDALRALERAQMLESGSSAIAADTAYAHYLGGNHDEAVGQLERITSVDPMFSGAYRYLARIYLIEARDREYLKMAATEAKLRADPAQAKSIAKAAAAFATGGRRAMISSLIADESTRFAQSGESALRVAMLYGAAGDGPHVEQWLQTAESVREPEIRSIPAFIEFVPYRNISSLARFFKPPES
ncbi:MAG: tetratricopeptide repeat protein [Sphingomonadaceae bacterium]